MLHALIHTGREKGTRKSQVRDGQGAYRRLDFDGPTFRCRLMQRGVAGETRRDDGQSSRVAREYELLAWNVDDAGVTLDLKPSMRLLVVDPLAIVTPPEGRLVDVDGEPELLTNGVERIGWFANVVFVQDAT